MHSLKLEKAAAGNVSTCPVVLLSKLVPTIQALSHSLSEDEDDDDGDDDGDDVGDDDGDDDDDDDDGCAPGGDLRNWSRHPEFCRVSASLLYFNHHHHCHHGSFFCCKSPKQGGGVRGRFRINILVKYLSSNTIAWNSATDCRKSP